MKKKIYSTLSLIMIIMMAQISFGQIDQGAGGTNLNDPHSNNPFPGYRSGINCSSTVLNTVISPAGPIGLCPGGSLVLDGDPNDDPFVKAWFWYVQGPDSLLPLGQTTDTLLVNTPGTYAVVGKDSAFCGDTAYVTVFAFAVPTDLIGGDTAYCENSSIVLSVYPDSTQFTSYNWSTGDTTRSISVGTTGQVIAWATDTNGCSLSDTVTISELPAPTVTLADAEFCPSDTATLDAGSGFTAYSWSPGGETTQVIDVVAPGSSAIFVTVTDANGCDGVSNTVAVTPFPDPVAPTVTFDGENLTSSEVTGNQWYDQDGIIAGETSNIYAPQEDGSYLVEYTDANGCVVFSDSIDVALNIVIPVGVSPLTPIANLTGLVNYPQNTFQIFNRYGNLVFEKAPMTGTDRWLGTTTDGNDLPAGTYFYVLDLGDGTDPITGYIEFVR